MRHCYFITFPYSDAKTIQFIKNRHKEKGDKPDVVPTRMSKFKKDKLVAAQTVSKTYGFLSAYNKMILVQLKLSVSKKK